MANKKINELDVRASLSLSDLMLVGDPATGYAYKTTLTDIKTLIATEADTLQTVTNRGATTTNTITAAGFRIANLAVFSNDCVYTYISNHCGSSGRIGFGFTNTVTPSASDALFDIYQAPAIAPGDLFTFRHTLANSTGNSTNYNIINIATAINQTGGSNGIVRGVYYNPTLTSLVGDHYAYESTSGKIKISDLAGTGSRMVVADASGVLSTSALPTSTNIYNSDGTLTGNRTVTMAGNSLTFSGGTLQVGNTSTWETYINSRTSLAGVLLRANYGVTNQMNLTFDVNGYLNMTGANFSAPNMLVTTNLQTNGSVTFNGNNKTAYWVNVTDQYVMGMSGNTFVIRAASSSLTTGGALVSTSFTNGNISFGGTTDAGFKADIIGSTRSQTYFTNHGTSSLNLLVSGQTAHTADRGVFIGGGTFSNASIVGIGIGSGIVIGTGTGSVAIGYQASASSGGIAISAGGNSATAAGGIAIGGGVVSNGGIGIGGASQQGSVAIYSTAQTQNAIVIGPSCTSNALYSVVIGDRASNAFQSSVVMGLFSKSTAANQLVIGSNDGLNNGLISDVYFGSGVQRNGTTNGAGSNYTINGSGALGTDFAGGSITIAGGKGTGSGTPGDIIFATSTATTTGTTLQTLTNRWWIKAGTGVLTNVSAPATAAIFQADSTTQGILPPRMTTTQKNAISAPVPGLVVYDTTLNKLCVYTTAWQTITSA